MSHAAAEQGHRVPVASWSASGGRQSRWQRCDGCAARRGERAGPPARACASGSDARPGRDARDDVRPCSGNPAWVDAVATEVRAEHPAVDVATTVLTGPRAHADEGRRGRCRPWSSAPARERSLQAALLSGISERLAAETPCPLIIVPVGEGSAMTRHGRRCCWPPTSTDSGCGDEVRLRVAHSTRRRCALLPRTRRCCACSPSMQLPPDDVILDHADDALRESLPPSATPTPMYG